MAGRIVLISDLDGTLLGDEDALGRFSRWCAARRQGITLVYASGRFHASVLASLRQEALPPPDAVIGGVGTEIHAHPGGRPLTAWTEQMPRAWDAGRVRALLGREPDLEPQPEEFQSHLKVSFFLRAATAGRLETLRASLRAAGIPVDLVYSGSRDLDVVPRGVNKGTAARFLVHQWGLESRQVIVSGDSGNDLGLFQQGFRGVVVGNAQADLRGLAAPSVFQARASFAAGVLEGLRHWTHEEEPDESDR